MKRYNESMDITKCDICKRQKREKVGSLNKKSEWISLSVHGKGDWSSFDLCDKCSENLLKYIKRYLGIKKSKKK